MNSTNPKDDVLVARRRVLAGGFAFGTVTAAGMALGQQVMQNFVPSGLAPKPKGPRVFMDYDKEEIDWAYDQAPWAPNAGEIVKRNAQKSAAALERLGPPRRLAYGPKDIEKLDVYYEDCVIGGPGAFVIPIENRDKFVEATRTKLVLEIAGRVPPARIIPVAADKPRVSCTVGERLWQERWGN